MHNLPTSERLRFPGRDIGNFRGRYIGKEKSLRGGQIMPFLLPHVNMPATVFVASNAGCPR